MFEFAMAHPIVTFFIIAVICACIHDTSQEWAQAFAARNRKERD